MRNKTNIVELIGDSDDWNEEQQELINDFYQLLLKKFPLPTIELDNFIVDDPDVNLALTISSHDRWFASLPLVKLCLARSDSTNEFDELSVFSASFSLQKLSKIFDLFVKNNDYNSARELLVAFSRHGLYEQKTFELLGLCLNSSINHYFNCDFIACFILDLHLSTNNEYHFNEKRLLSGVEELANKCFEKNYWNILVHIVTSFDLPNDLQRNLKARFLRVYMNHQQAMSYLAKTEEYFSKTLSEEKIKKDVQKIIARHEADHLIKRVSRK